MLKVLAGKLPNVVPILGVVENIVGSVEATLKYVDVPKRFNALYSVLMLHHCVDVGRAFQSMFEALSSGGRAVIIDLCQHPFKEFREEMGDIHLGFSIEEISRLALKLFRVHVSKIPGIKCTSTSRSAELFVAVLDR